ncbi:MAG: hypothetical protein WCL02_06840 [bacterium]
MKKLKTFTPDEKDFEIFLQWVEEMKKINKINKEGPIVYNAEVHEYLAKQADGLPTFSSEEPLDNDYEIVHIFIVEIGFKTEEMFDKSAFVFHFGKRYGAINAWCKNGCDEEHNAPLVEIWDEFCEKEYPNTWMEKKFTTTELWEILTKFISWEQKISPLK